MTTIERGSERRVPAAVQVWLERRGISAFTIGIAAAVLLGIAVRSFHVLSSAFPLNDGGMFYAMARDLQDSSYALPDFTTYNGGSIPFTYPPAGFYLSALLDDLTPLTLVGVFRFLPLIATCLTIPAFYLLARSMLTSKVAVVAAVLAFALIPRSFMWLLMGGGVTRSLGFLFAILALYCMHQVYAHRRSGLIPWAAATCSLTVLSHLETGWFLAFSIAMFYVAYGRNRRATIDSAIVATSTVLITSIWWVQVLAAHGLEPLKTAFGTGGSIFSGGEATDGAIRGLLNVVSTSEPLFPLIGVLAAFGGLACLSSRRYFLPAWWAAIVILDVRAFPTFTAIPVAMMAGIFVSEVLLPLIANQREAEQRVPQRWGEAGVLAALLVFAVASSLLRAPNLGGEAMNLRGLSNEELAAIGWLRDETPSGSSVLVVPDSSWETAKTAEWLPVLAQRYSVATVQGTEWVSNGGFSRAREIYDHAFDCGYQTTTCLAELTEERGIDFDYVYVRKGDLGQCCQTLLTSLTADENYELVYDDVGATIFQKRQVSEPAVQAPTSY